MITRRISFIILTTLILAMMTGFTVHAQNSPAAQPASEAEKTKVTPTTIPCVPNLPCIQEDTQKGGGQSVRDYILKAWGSNFITGFLTLIGLGAVVFLIVGGAQMVLGAGTEENVTTARKTIMWAIIGLVVSILSVTFVRIISHLPFK